MPFTVYEDYSIQNQSWQRVGEFIPQETEAHFCLKPRVLWVLIPGSHSRRRKASEWRQEGNLISVGCLLVFIKSPRDEHPEMSTPGWAPGMSTPGWAPRDEALGWAILCTVFLSIAEFPSRKLSLRKFSVFIYSKYREVDYFLLKVSLVFPYFIMQYITT